MAVDSAVLEGEVEKQDAEVLLPQGKVLLGDVENQAAIHMREELEEGMQVLEQIIVVQEEPDMHWMHL